MSQTVIAKARSPFLSFAEIDAEDGKIINYWSVNPTGNYAADCETGRFYAYELIDYIAATGYPAALGYVASAMPQADRRTGLETAFWSAIAAEAAGART